MSFKEYENNIKSQFGEDGVIEEIFNRIGCSNKICVEFGAWDGIHLSNAWNLWNNKGWQALLIEGDKEKYKVLVNTTKDFDNVKPYLAYITASGDTSIGAILKKLQYPKDIDLLSIDIDGDDYYIFESLNEYFPRVIIVEYNPTIPPDVELVQAEGEYLGSSALSILKLAHKKKYKLAHMTETNMFFINESDFGKLGIEEPLLESVFVKSNLTYLISTYDGKCSIVGNATYSQFETRETQIKYPKVISDNRNIKNVIVHNAFFKELAKKNLYESCLALCKKVLRK